MMRWIVGGSLRFRFLLAFFAAALVVFGVDRVRDMKVDVFPEFAPPLVEVQTEAVGLSTEEVEGLITVPLEQAFSGIPGLETLRSKTVPGLSSVIMLFERGTDLIRARQLVQERLAQAQPLLPNVARPPFMIQPLSATSRVMKIGVSSSDHTADRAVRDLSLEDATAADAACRASPTSPPGATASASCRSRSTRNACRPTASP